MKSKAVQNLRRNAVLLLAAGVLMLGLPCGCGPHRAHRKHAHSINSGFDFLARTIDFSFTADHPLTRKEAEKDLDELEWVLEKRFSYLKLKGVDYRAALDSIRSSFHEDTRRGAVALQLMKFLALFGDAHSHVGGPGLKRMCSEFLPFLIEQSKGRRVAFKADRSGFLDREHPFLCRIDGIDLDVWLQAAGLTVPKGSPQYIRFQSIRRLRYIQYLRKELGSDPSRTVQVELESADGSSTRTLELPVADARPEYGSWPPTDSQILPGNIGCLRIPRWMSDEPEFLEGLVSSMGSFRETEALIIDIRGIGGGSRAPLRVLFPFFMADNDPPQVLNIAAYRLGHREGILDARWLYPADWEGWSPAEREAIKKAAEHFQPEWLPPTGEFSDWHYFVIDPSRKPGYYHYDRPVIILMETKNGSASDIFLGAFKGWRNVSLMGSPSGGCSGRYQNYRLRHSHIKIGLSSMASFRPNGKLYDGRGIQPDVPAEPAPTDFIGETDTVLDAAIQRLSKKAD